MAKHYSQLTPEEQAAKFSRLPSWAQIELRNLRATVVCQARELEEHRSGTYGPADTNTVADPYADQPIHLPKDTSIEFNLDLTGKDSRKVVRVRILKNGKLDVNANGTLWLNPRASNSVEISMGDR